MDSEFEAAAAWISKQSGLSNDTKLQLYALYKIATVSKAPNNSRPAFWDMTGRAKWDAWQHTGEELSKADKLDDADDLYVDLVKSLGWEQGNSESTAQDQGGASKGMVSVSTMAAESEPVPEPGERTIHDLATDGALTELQERCPLQDVNKKDGYGFTPLHLASDRGHAQIVTLLLQQGADPSIKDADGFTPLELAEVAERMSVIALLKSQNDQS